MFELGIALKYLIPRKKSLSTALISLLSVLVISLVVWLVLVFLSVTSGIEKNWLSKLTTLHAPVRISPTDTYFSSYYYKIDSQAASSKYALKTIGEKAASLSRDPYVAEVDGQLPAYFPQKEEIDPVKVAYGALQDLGLAFQDYEMGAALLKLNRDGSTLSQMSFLLSEPKNNPKFASLIMETGATTGTPVLLPKNYKDAGIKLGDTGSLNYSGTSGFSLQEHKIVVTVAGFYDPGLASFGNKCAIVPEKVVRQIQSASQSFSPDGTPTNGIFVWFNDLTDAPAIKEKIAARFAELGIGSYWKIDTYKDFEFSKDLMQQFQSDKTLLLMIAAIILLVACSNIISLLVLLVNDKKKEIAILQSMGASFGSIAAIFGICGAVLGALGCILGSTFAIVTLYNMETISSFLSALQGHTAFNPAFFGKTLPNQLSREALLFVFIATPILSLLAGLIPAIKASRITASTVLRAE